MQRLQHRVTNLLRHLVLHQIGGLHRHIRVHDAGPGAGGGIRSGGRNRQVVVQRLHVLADGAARREYLAHGGAQHIQRRLGAGLRCQIQRAERINADVVQRVHAQGGQADQILVQVIRRYLHDVRHVGHDFRRHYDVDETRI